jgi:hypothetical protein
MITRKAAKVTLKARGWSQRRAAEHLGVSQTHLSLCLNGYRVSRRLMLAIEAMPESPTPYMASGFAHTICRKGGKQQPTRR